MLRIGCGRKLVSVLLCVFGLLYMSCACLHARVSAWASIRVIRACVCLLFRLFLWACVCM